MLNSTEILELRKMIAFFEEHYPKGVPYINNTLVPADEYCTDLMVFLKSKENDRIERAVKKYNTTILGYEPCQQLCFNLPEAWQHDQIKDLIPVILNWNNKIIKGSIFVVEFYGKSGKWNPHIHFWVPKSCSLSRLRDAAIKKFSKYKFNVFAKDGHSNLKNYVMGNKIDIKEVALSKDKVVRQQEGYEHFYKII